MKSNRRYAYIENNLYNMIVWYLDLQLPMYLVPITTCIMSSNTTHGEVIKFVSDLRKVGGFLWILWFPPQIKMNCHEIAKILLNVSLNTITLTLFYWLKKKRYFTMKQRCKCLKNVYTTTMKYHEKFIFKYIKQAKNVRYMVL